MPLYLRQIQLKPFCLYHATAMKADAEQQTSNPTFAASGQSYICESAGCDLSWEWQLGYFRKTTTALRASESGIGGKRCPTAAHAFLFVSGFSTAGRIWRCSTAGCPHTEIELGWADKQG
jgi:hypothetical protein